MTCIDCGEKYTREEITTWEEEGKVFIVNNEKGAQGNLICPRCTAEIINTPINQQIRELLRRTVIN